MPNEYPIETRRRARRLWLAGKSSDEQIATQLGIPRADTIRDWRNAEGWRLLADDIAKVVDEEVQEGLRAKAKATRGVYEQLAQVVEAASVRHLKNPTLSPRDLKAISGALLNSQRIREKAGGAAGGKDDFGARIAEAMRLDRVRQDRLSLDLCRTATSSEESDTAVPPESGATATRGLDGVSAAH